VEAVAILSEEAQVKWDELDADGSGELSGVEVDHLAEWVWYSFHPQGVEMTEAEHFEEAEKILHRCDLNGDRSIDRQEFSDYYDVKAREIFQFAQQMEAKKIRREKEAEARREAQAQKEAEEAAKPKMNRAAWGGKKGAMMAVGRAGAPEEDTTSPYTYQYAPGEEPREEPAPSKAVVMKSNAVSERAMKKFHQLDADDSHRLEGNEVLVMAEWVFKSFHDGKGPNVKERINEAAKILEKCDKDGDGSIDEFEFSEYFHMISQSIDAFKKAEAQRKKSLRRLKQLEPTSPRRNREASELSSPRSKPAGSQGGLSTEDQLEVAMKSAEGLRKFHELDYDGSGVLEGEEVVELGRWVYAAFHDGAQATREEATDMAQKIMERSDHDGDGTIDEDEFAEYYEKTCVAIRKFEERQRAGNEDTTQSSPVPPLDLSADAFERRKQKGAITEPSTGKQSFADATEEDAKGQAAYEQWQAEQAQKQGEDERSPEPEPEPEPEQDVSDERDSRGRAAYESYRQGTSGMHQPRELSPSPQNMGIPGHQHYRQHREMAAQRYNKPNPSQMGSLSRIQLVDVLHQAFEKCDEDSVGFVRKSDLLQSLNILAQSQPSVAELEKTIEDMNTVIVDQADFDQAVEEWRDPARAGRRTKPRYIPRGDVPSEHMQELVDAFHYCDYENRGVVPMKSLVLKVGVISSMWPTVCDLHDRLASLDQSEMGQSEWSTLVDQWATSGFLEERRARVMRMSEGPEKEEALDRLEAKELRSAKQADINSEDNAVREADRTEAEARMAALQEDRDSHHRLVLDEAAQTAAARNNRMEADAEEHAEKEREREMRRQDVADAKAMQQREFLEETLDKAEVLSPRHKRTGELSRGDLMPEIMALYEKVDADDTGFAQTEEILEEMQHQFGSSNNDVYRLQQTVESTGTVIMDRESFENIVMEWTKGN